MAHDIPPFWAHNEINRPGPVLFLQRKHPGAILPTRGSKYSAGYDLYANEATALFSGQRKLINTGLSVFIPYGCYGRIAPRSGLAVKGVDVCAGVIDSDYRGEVKVLLHFPYSPSSPNDRIQINRGDRIAQLILEKYLHCDIVEQDELDMTERGEGGFGSTGK